MDHHTKESQEYPSPSHARCFCLFSLLFLTMLILATAILIIAFGTRLRKPVLHLEAIQMDSGKDACSIASLLFAAQNPNEIGIRYGASVLELKYANETVGEVEVPEFYQPPRSDNVTVLMHALFVPRNITRLVVQELSQQRKYAEIRIFGRVEARTHVMNFPLPKIQFLLDCRIGTNYSEIVMRKGMKFINTRKALVISTLPQLSQKCTLRIDMRSKRNRTEIAGLGC